MLLPLPDDKVRRISLENHLALALMGKGHGSVEQMTRLLKVVYMTYFLNDAGAERSEIEVFHDRVLPQQSCRGRKVSLPNSLIRANGAQNRR
jgi:hypothetical protein